MATMVRKQIYIKPEQGEMLKELAAKLRISEAELIREGINHALIAPVFTYKDRQAWSKIRPLYKNSPRKAM